MIGGVFLRGLIYAGAIWPVVLAVGWWAPWFRRGRIAEWKWTWFFGLYTALLVAGVLVHYHWIAEWHEAPHAFPARDGIGWRASLPLNMMERWLLLGAAMSLGVALRGDLKPGYWWGPPRRRAGWW